MNQEQLFRELEDLDLFQGQQIQVNPSRQKMKNKKTKLTKFIAQIFYKRCPQDKKKLFNLFWQDYSSQHHLDTTNLTQKKTIERRFNQILNAMQACGFVKKNKRIIDIISQNVKVETVAVQQSNRSQTSQKIKEQIELKKSTNQKQIDIQDKTERINYLKQLITSLKDQFQRNRFLGSEHKQIDLQSIVLITNQDKLLEISTFNNKKSIDHQVTVRGQFNVAGELFQMLKLIQGSKQQIKTYKD